MEQTPDSVRRFSSNHTPRAANHIPAAMRMLYSSGKELALSVVMSSSAAHDSNNQTIEMAPLQRIVDLLCPRRHKPRASQRRAAPGGQRDGATVGSYLQAAGLTLTILGPQETRLPIPFQVAQRRWVC